MEEEPHLPYLIRWETPHRAEVVYCTQVVYRDTLKNCRAWVKTKLLDAAFEEKWHLHSTKKILFPQRRQK